MNAVLGPEPTSAQTVAAETGLPEAYVRRHFRWLLQEGYAEGDANAVRLVARTATSQPPAPQTIRIDPEVWRALQKQAEPFVETPNDVLRRLLGLGSRRET
jgi:hypothetical protein